MAGSPGRRADWRFLVMGVSCADQKAKTAIASEHIAFKAASDKPAIDHWISSHNTACWPKSRALNCSKVSAAPPPLVQADGPANQCCSTPAW